MLQSLRKKVMAKFAKWRGFVDQSRDLARGLYALTFKENMPGEPEAKEWVSTTVSPPSCSFTLVSLPSSGSDDIANNYYTMIGNRCFFRMEADLIVSGSAQSVFWIRLPAPAKSLENARFTGKYFDLSSSDTVNRSIFVDVIVGSPSEWWAKLTALSETATMGAWPRGSGQLSIEGDYEVDAGWIRTGSFPITTVSFTGTAGSNFVDFSSTVDFRASSGSAITVNSKYASIMSLGDYGIVQLYVDATMPNPAPSFIKFTLPRTVKNLPFTVPEASGFITRWYAGSWLGGAPGSGDTKIVIKPNDTYGYIVPCSAGVAAGLVALATYQIYAEFTTPLEP